MTSKAIKVITAFESLSPDEQHAVAAEILRRSSGTGGLSDEALDELAAELFRMYDAEEASRAER